jgi:hypothetical protein
MVKVIPYLGENITKTASGVFDFIKKETIDYEYKKYIVAVTGQGRMGDTFPNHCNVALDFTHEPSNLTAWLQGLLGRLSGYYKDSTVYISKNSYKKYMTWVNFEEKSIKLPRSHITTLSSNNYKMFHVQNNFNQKIKNNFKKLEDIIFYDKNGKINLGKNLIRNMTSILNNNFLNYLEKISQNKIKLLRFGEIDELGFSYGETINGQPLLTRRSDSEKSRRGGRVNININQSIIVYCNKYGKISEIAFKIFQNGKPQHVPKEQTVPYKLLG